MSEAFCLHALLIAAVLATTLWIAEISLLTAKNGYKPTIIPLPRAELQNLQLSQR